MQTDVMGTCKVDYVFDGADANAIRVLKTHDFSSCTNRYGLSDALSSVPYRFFGAVSNILIAVSIKHAHQFNYLKIGRVLNLFR
jgi:dTDP-4-dehydrorhamnose reductase